MTQRKEGTWLAHVTSMGEKWVSTAKRMTAIWDGGKRISVCRMARFSEESDLESLELSEKLQRSRPRGSLTASSPALTTPDTFPNQPRRFRLLPKSGATKRFPR